MPSSTSSSRANVRELTDLRPRHPQGTADVITSPSARKRPLSHGVLRSETSCTPGMGGAASNRNLTLITPMSASGHEVRPADQMTPMPISGARGSTLTGCADVSMFLPDTPAALYLGRSSSVDGVSPLAYSRDSTWVILDYGVTAEQGVRRTMEDQHVTLAEGIPFFGVYDGHGGTQCAEYLRDNLHRFILCHPELKTNPEKAVSDGILEAERRFLQRCADEKIESGSVCAVALFVRGRIIVGNVGDTEAVLCRGGAALVLTTVHHPKRNPKEKERIAAAGGRMLGNRVGHPKFNPSVLSLAVTRAIGDAGFKLDEYTDGKPSGIIAVPDTKSITLTPEDEFLIIGCDGLWDVMSHEEVIAFCRDLISSGCPSADITERLVDEALSMGTTDNVTVVYVSCRPTSAVTVAAVSTTASSHHRSTTRISSASSGRPAATTRSLTSPEL